ncbi:hypothetical protein D3C72_2589620 [compost metagenome]
MPTGGVMRAASTKIMIKIPSQTGSKPKAIITGATMGMVVIIIDSVSMNMPRIR